MLATPDTPYDIHTEETENRAYEDDYAAYASLQSVTTETLSPDKPLENIASAADTGTENTSAATAGDQKTSIQTPQVQTPLTTPTQQKQERFLNLQRFSLFRSPPLNQQQKTNLRRALYLPLIPVKKCLCHHR